MTALPTVKAASQLNSWQLDTGLVLACPIAAVPGTDLDLFLFII
jgi:hypothetical protein